MISRIHQPFVVLVWLLFSPGWVVAAPTLGDICRRNPQYSNFCITCVESLHIAAGAASTEEDGTKKLAEASITCAQMMAATATRNLVQARGSNPSYTPCILLFEYVAQSLDCASGGWHAGLPRVVLIQMEVVRSLYFQCSPTLKDAQLIAMADIFLRYSETVSWLVSMSMK